MSKYNSLAPEALSQRPDLDHRRFESVGQPMDISGVTVKFGGKNKPHTYTAPTGDGVVSRRLRRFALTLTRFQMPRASTFAKRVKITESSLEAATNIIACHAYGQAFGDDATNGTIDTGVLVSLLNEPNPSKESFMKAFSFIGTDAYQQILKGVANPAQVGVMSDMNETVVGTWLTGWRWNEIIMINDRDQRKRRASRIRYQNLAHYLMHQSSESAEAFRKKSNSEAKRADSQQYGNGKAQVAEGGGWYPLYVSKPDLPLNHTGKLGRRDIASDEGVVIRDISRWITDPERKIFKRKTKSLGAVVVMDCSGSMSLRDTDLQQLMDNTSGATVLCYSTGSKVDEDNPNAWIVARKNRQVRRLPRFPGGNGCDAPALRYALTLRDSTKQPIVWVTDYGVTGLHDSSTQELIDECKGIVKRHGIIVMPDIHDAIQKLKQLQGKA